jgi:hypothetical protein
MCFGLFCIICTVVILQYWHKILMYFDVQLEICSLMALVSICTQFLVLLWPDGGTNCGRNWSPFNKHFHKSVLVVNGEY